MNRRGNICSCTVLEPSIISRSPSSDGVQPHVKLLTHDGLNVENLDFNDSWLFTSADEDGAMWLKAAEHMLHIYKEILDVFLLQMVVVLRGLCRLPFSKSGWTFNLGRGEKQYSIRAINLLISKLLIERCNGILWKALKRLGNKPKGQ